MSMRAALVSPKSNFHLHFDISSQPCGMNATVWTLVVVYLRNQSTRAHAAQVRQGWYRNQTLVYEVFYKRIARLYS